MKVSVDFVIGRINDRERVLEFLDRKLLPRAVNILNKVTLPEAVVLFPDDVLPTNQRNLTDVRTRIGILLEYEFARAIAESLQITFDDQGVALTYVIANQFPDLAFRTIDGQIGIRFELKAIQTIAEEKSANFSTLIKDIRKDTDFVVVLLWEWSEHESRTRKSPYIYRFFVMDAYQLAQMRDCYWLNNPPSGLSSARQGFDLTFAVNARDDSYNKEEGNYGKLMRIFNSDFQYLLPDSIRQGKTLRKYYVFNQEAVRLGLKHIGQEIAAQSTGQEEGTYFLVSDTLPVCFLSTYKENRLLILGYRSMPSKQQVMPVMEEHAAHAALLLNEKFQWVVRDKKWKKVEEGNKPAGAMKWVREDWKDFNSPYLI